MSLCRFPRDIEPIAQAEADARTMMDAAGVGWLAGSSDENWEAAFGDSETALRELVEGLERRYHTLPWWRRRGRAERRAIRAHYIQVQAMLTVAYGCETVWR